MALGLAIMALAIGFLPLEPLPFITIGQMSPNE
jgi:hypothetical protein